MSSGLSFLMQLIENDMCFLNTQAYLREKFRNYESKGNFRMHAYQKMQKLIINYLHIFGPMDKESLFVHLKDQLVSSLLKRRPHHSDLDKDDFFECALSEVIEVSNNHDYNKHPEKYRLNNSANRLTMSADQSENPLRHSGNQLFHSGNQKNPRDEGE